MQQKFKKGAASMYVVVIAALLFGVITVSFIRIIVSNSLRTTNDELAQSAYDSALAGVEDAKTALIKYYSCLGGTDVSSVSLGSLSSANSCQRAVYFVGKALNGDTISPSDQENCATINNALARNGENYNTDQVEIVQTTGSNSNTDQAYTCVTLNDKLSDYRATLSSGVTVRVIPLKYVSGDAPNGITGIKIGWYDSEDGTDYDYDGRTDGNYKFSADYATPPVISAQVIQTDSSFSLEDFTRTVGDKTDRGTLFLSPIKKTDNSITHFDKNALLDSNRHQKENKPSVVKCKEKSTDTYPDEEFACMTTIELPDPIGTNAAGRNPDTFFLVITLPYGNPTTHFSVQLCTDNDVTRGNCKDDITGQSSTAKFDGVQTSVDSTGRANDMFSRVEARVELSDVYFPYAEFALQLSGDGDDTLNKNFYVTKNCWTNNSSTTCQNSGTAN